MAKADRDIAIVATGQLGVVSRAQANRAGLSDGQLRGRVQSGFLEQIGPNAFRLVGTATTPLSRLTGLVIDVGPPCWVAGPTAAALHRLDGFELGEPFHLVTPRARQVRRAGHHIHTTMYLPPGDRVEVDGLPTVRVARTIVDLARVVDRATLAAAVDAAIRDRRITEEGLHHRVARLRGRGRFGVQALIDVLEGREVTRGGHSFLEREFLALLARHDLPRPDCQQVLGRAGDRLVRVDFRFPGTNVVVEVMGYRIHRTRDQLRRDAQRMNRLLADGYRPYHFTYDQVMDDPNDVVGVLVAAFRQATA